MKLNGIKIILTATALLTLASCAHKKTNQQYADNGYRNGAQASGYGRESGFGEEGSNGANGRLASSKNLYYFDYDSYKVRDADKPAIASNAQYLKSHPQSKIMLEGHTDPRGSREYNVGLGERRAKAVASELTAQGVKPAQVALVSYGAEKRAAQGYSESDYQQDRRSAIVYDKN